MANPDIFWYYYKKAKVAHVWEPYPIAGAIYERPLWKTACGRIYLSEREYINRAHLHTEVDAKVPQCKHCLKKVSK